MRYVLAIAALVLSGILLLLGIGQRTFLAGPMEITIPVDTRTETGYATIDADEITKLPGQANIVARGGEAFVATGATRDVEAWTEPYSHAQLTIDAQDQRMLSALIAPAIPDVDPAEESATDPDAAPESVDPRGSDLWLQERSTEAADEGSSDQTTLRVPVALSSGQSVLIASNGSDPVPADVSIVWTQDPHTPWAGPLLAGGALLALVGGVLYLLAIDHDRRGLGPRRGRKGPLLGIRNAFGRKRRKGGDAATRIALPVAGLALVVGLTGCSANYWPSFAAESETPTEEDTGSGLATVPVTEGQMDRVLSDVAAISGSGDDELDAALLESRFAGDALAQRTANYTIRGDLSDYGVVPPRITEDKLGYELVQSTEGWPRTMFVTVASTSGQEEDAGEDVQGEDAEPDAEAQEDTEAQEEAEASSPSLALVLTQEDPHANFLVTRVISLRGGISMPQAAPAEEGTAVLSGDLEGLVLKPEEVGSAYAAVLQNGPDAEEAENFDLSTDTLLENYGKARADSAQAESDADDQTMVFSVTADQGEEPITALSTGTGGALVATTVVEEQIVDADGGRYKPQASGAVSALSDLEGEQERIVQQVAHQMLFYVPSNSGGEKIQLLGVSSELVGVRN